jgi:WD40 repeat protein
MESSYLLEKKIISMCFNPLRDTVFLLSAVSEKLDLTEEDLTKNIILRRFRLLRTTECNIVNQNFRRIPNDTYEGYSIYFWEMGKKILVVYPFGYLLIYDYYSSNLIYHFQCQGKKTYSIRNIIGSPIQNSLFFSAEGMRNIYHVSYGDSIRTIGYNKLVIPEGSTVFDLVCHPNEKYIFAACSDSIVRIFDYSVTTNITEVRVGLVDVMLGKDNKPPRNQSEIIKKNNILSVISLDINTTGTYLLSGNENGYIYLWDAMSAIKNKRNLLAKERFSSAGILSVRFIKTKQFENLNRFICLTKEGKFFILNIICKEDTNKTFCYDKLYENSIFNQIIYPLTRYNLITSNFVNISYHTNMICLKWPTLKMDRIKLSPDKVEEYLLFTNFNAKFFFIYDNQFPKINYALASQMPFKNYEDYIPLTGKKNLTFTRQIFVVDNFFVYYYDIMSGQSKKIFNYVREFNLKSIFPLKFEVRQSNPNDVFFIILVETENYQKLVLFVSYSFITNTLGVTQRFNEVIDFVCLGTEEIEFKELFLLSKSRQVIAIYNWEAKQLMENINIDGTVLRLYNTPFTNGYTVLYRNTLSELKFSSNINAQNNAYDFRCDNINTYRLDYSEREIDIVWKKADMDKWICAISMIEKIVITDENLRILYMYKISLLENPNIVSSLYWIGRTLFYTKGSSINYFYGEDGIHQKVFSSDQSNAIISGILSDRYILVSKIHASKDLNNIVITTPMLNPLEPILVGYLDSNSIDYHLVKEAITNMFSNQISQHLIDKLIKRDLKEVAWALLNDPKCSFPNTDKKVLISNDLLKFDSTLDNILPNKNLHNDMDLDELLWRFNYDSSFDYLKNLLIGECNILMQYGQFEMALKILELISDYPKAINLLLLASSKEEFTKLRIMFQARHCLSYTDNLLINNLFHASSGSKDDNNKSYSKVFDNYKGEPFIFGANQDKLGLINIKDVVNKINKKNSHISNIQKKLLSFGESPFTQYTKVEGVDGEVELVNICTLIIQKIDQFYGYKNTVHITGTHQQEKK